MPIPIPKITLSEDTARFVEACQRLKSTDPTGWAEFFGAFAVLAVNEFKKAIKENGDASARATAQGRAQFADLVSETMDNCTPLAIEHRKIDEQRKKVEAEQKRNKGTLLSP